MSERDLDNIIEADGAAALGEPVIGASDGLEAGAPGGSEVTEPIVSENPNHGRPCGDGMKDGEGLLPDSAKLFLGYWRRSRARDYLHIFPCVFGNTQRAHGKLPPPLISFRFEGGETQWQK